MIGLSVRTLHEGFYDRDVVESAVRWGYRVDPGLIGEEGKGGEMKREKRGGVWVIVASGSSGAGVGDGDGDKERTVGTNSDGNGEMEEEREVIVAVGAILLPSLSIPTTSSLSTSSLSTSSQSPSQPCPPKEAAKLKALFTHPSFVRLGLASIMLRKCEDEVRKAGYRWLEFSATVRLFFPVLRLFLVTTPFSLPHNPIPFSAPKF